MAHEGAPTPPPVRGHDILLLLLALSAVLAGLSAGAVRSAEANELPTLVYVSDYFSFVGADDQGHVAFALDNNRGRDGEAYQAEHFLVLHDESRGWVDVVGNGAYENHDRELSGIPDSTAFQFDGSPRSGMTITSRQNDLVLRIEPISERLSRAHGEARFWLGSAPAMLEWSGRRLTGRVIYEHLYKPEFNRLTRTYFGMWNDFQGFYMSIDGTGDLYLHSQQSEQLAPLVGNLIGFAVIDGRHDSLEDLEFLVRERRLTLGLYRWPTAWRIRWTGDRPSSMEFTLRDRRVLANWIIGGFAMGVIKGELRREGRTYPFYGLAELIK